MVFLVGINVPRSRFLPVKTTSDLLIIMSNLYSLRAGFLEMNPKRSFPSVPLSKLGSHFTKVCYLSFPSVPLSKLGSHFTKVCYLSFLSVPLSKLGSHFTKVCYLSFLSVPLSKLGSHFTKVCYLSFPSVPLSKLGSHFTKLCHSSGPQITKTYVVGTQKNRLDETALLSTQNTLLH